MIQIDLNLLLVFDAVMAERNLRRAAERLGRTQSAVSQSMARLRDQFADRLFTKTPTGIEPTPRAEALWEEVRGPLAAMCAAVAPETFDPAAARGTITLGLSDDLELLAFGPITAQLLAEAPHLSVHATPVDHVSLARDIRDGRVDLAVSVAERMPRGIAREELYRQPFVVLRRADATKVATLKQYLRAPHVAAAFATGAPGFTDVRLAQLGHERRLIATTPRFAALAGLIEATGALATMPGPLARLLARRGGLAIDPVPFDLPAVPVALLWHERRRAEPLHVWLRRHVRAAVLQAREQFEVA